MGPEHKGGMDMSLPQQATVVEVGPRDGFQNEHDFVPTEQKIEIIDALSETGLRRIEATAFVHPKAIPQLADAAEVMAKIKRRRGVEYEALIPNARGMERAIQAGVDAVCLVVSASESHNMNNVRMSVADSLEGFRKVAEMAHQHGVKVTGGISTAFGCAIEGWVAPEKVVDMAEAFVSMGVQEISLADTAGMGDPALVTEVIQKVRKKTGDMPLRLHLHNTRGAGLANVFAGLTQGVTVFDGSICGLGGCPFSPGATGNIATGDLVNMLESMKIDTGVDLPKLIDCERHVRAMLARDLPGHVMKAGVTPWAVTP